MRDETTFECCTICFQFYHSHYEDTSPYTVVYVMWQWQWSGFKYAHIFMRGCVFKRTNAANHILHVVIFIGTMIKAKQRAHTHTYK